MLLQNLQIAAVQGFTELLYKSLEAPVLAAGFLGYSYARTGWRSQATQVLERAMNSPESTGLKSSQSGKSVRLIKARLSTLGRLPKKAFNSAGRRRNRLRHQANP